MGQRTRILIAVAILAVLIGVVLGIDALRRGTGRQGAAGEPTLAPGAVPVYLDARLLGGLTPADLERLETVSFTDAEDGVLQTGWLLRDVVRLYMDVELLGFPARVTLSSSVRNKSAELSWAEVDDPANFVMFDLSNRGTLKLVSMLDRLDTRDEWVQDVDRIEIGTK